MDDAIKASYSTVQVGIIGVDGFQLPDGSYRMSQTQAAEAIGKPEINARRFLQSSDLKRLLGKGYTPDTIEVNSTQLRGQTRINALPLDVVTAYWLSQAAQGNKQALALVWALLTETLERRFDAAFQVDRTETERNDRLTQRLQTLERDLAALGDAYAWPDVQRDHIAALEAQIKALGAEPWQPPAIED
jgi:hypothetical protein